MRLLIADDDLVTRRLLTGFLTRWGHEVVEAVDGAQAWELFQQEEFPIVISDWVMPNMDGLEFIRRIRAAEREAYVYAILVTSKSEKSDIVAGMEAGADDFIVKPFDREELRVRLREGERIIRLERSLAHQNQALREAQVALVQSEKLASLGQLAAGMSHEINNPIAFVKNNLVVLRRDGGEILELLDKYRSAAATLAQLDPALAAEIAAMEEAIDLSYLQQSLRRLLDSSLQGLERVRGIVSNLRDFANLDQAEYKEININAALRSTMQILHHELTRRNIKIQADLQNLPPLACEAGKISQVLYNVLLNAAQACAAEGIICVQTRCEDSAIVIEIRDNGIGIAPEQQRHLFEPFFTTRPVGEGVGLGLATSYAIVRDHGGTIAVESRLGEGSTFRIRLPLKPEEYHSAISSDPSPEIPS
jgi:signal transduction histidine kinase